MDDHGAAGLSTAARFVPMKAGGKEPRPVRVYRLAAHATAEAPRPALPLLDKPSLVVLPFQNMSGAAEQEYFADGITEEITTALNRIRQFFMITRNTAFIYKGKKLDLRQVGRELGVRYPLEASVRKAGNRVRITDELIGAESGTHLWADKFDGALEDVVDLHDRITKSGIGASLLLRRQSDRAPSGYRKLRTPERPSLGITSSYRARWRISVDSKTPARPWLVRSRYVQPPPCPGCGREG